MEKTPKKQKFITQINDFIIKICQVELQRLFDELKVELLMKIESDIAIAMIKIKEVFSDKNSLISELFCIKEQ